MYIPRCLNTRPYTTALVVLICIWTVYLLDWKSVSNRFPAADVFRPQEIDPIRDNFIAVAAVVEVPAFDPEPIRDLCASTAWRTDLVFHCDEATGGLHNVRQQIITCVRFAIAFRAGLNMPMIKPRLESNTNDVVHEYKDQAVGLSYLFDQDIFLDRLKESCPQMKIYGPEDAKLVGKMAKLESPPLGDIDKKPETFFAEQHISVQEPGMINFIKAAGVYEICHDGEHFANTIGQVLLLRKDTRRLAAAVLYELAKQHSIDIGPSQGIIDSAFFAIHLRTSPDATRSHWLSYEDQSKSYHQYATAYSLPVIYVASGNLSSINMFSELVAPTPVVTKYTLLASRPKDLAELKKLSWDQQAEIDYLVLLRASKYLGMTDSNFSWAVAIARRAIMKEGTCGGPNHNGIVGFRAANDGDVGIAYEDETSVIIGGPCRFRFETRAWP